MTDFNKFEEYKLFVEDTARFTERRQTVSNIYVVVNSLLLTAIGLMIKELDAKDLWFQLVPIPLTVAGIFVSLWWHQLIHKYKELVGLRIKKLREMEVEMPDSVKMYHAEDEIYPRKNGNMIPGKGLNFADLEAQLPILFVTLYSIFGIGSLAVLAFKVYRWCMCL